MKVIGIKYYREILEEDYRAVEQIVLPSTLKKLSQLKQAYIEKYLRHYIKSKLAKFLQTPSEVTLLFSCRLGPTQQARGTVEICSDTLRN